MRRRLPPASWLELAATTIRGAADIEIEHMVDPEDAAIAWFAEEREPQQIDLDPVDRALAAWLAGQTEVTRETYQLSLRQVALRLGFAGLRPVRELVEFMIEDPKALDEQLAGLGELTGWRSGTVRNRLTAVHRASRALLRAKLLKRTVADERPRDTDVKIDRVTSEQVDAIEAALEVSNDPLSVRTRAVLLLAWNIALRPEQLERLRIKDLHLARSSVSVDDELVHCGKHTADAITAWLEHRGRAPGPLFVAFDGRTGRMLRAAVGARGFQRSIAAAGAAVGVHVTLSALRNGALLEIAEHDRLVAQRLSRNASEDGVNRLMRIAHDGA